MKKTKRKVNYIDEFGTKIYASKIRYTTGEINSGAKADLLVALEGNFLVALYDEDRTGIVGFIYRDNAKEILKKLNQRHK